MADNCVIVGYGPGVAAGVARAFGAEGMSLALIARNAAKLDSAVSELARDGREGAGFAADAGDPASLAAAIEAARQRFGDPAVLVYNAAVWRPGPVLETDPAVLAGDLAIDVGGALAAARAVAPAMRARRSGSILFTGGGFALYPSPVAPTLSMGKAAIRSLALMLAEELAPANVRVGTVTIMGTVAPGTRFDPDAIAGAFLDLHRGPADPHTAETRFA